MKTLIRNIAEALVDEPNQVRINEISGTNTSVIELSVAQSDIGKIIGKQGRTAQAMRTLLNAVSGKHRRRVSLEILQ